MSSKKQHRPSDISIYYDVDKFEKLEKCIDVLPYPEALLLVALFGVNNDRRIPLNKKDGKDNTHTFSRTVYQRNEIQTESNFGLITILNNLDKGSSEVVNKMAFAKMYHENISFVKLPNVICFYESLIGGIEPLHDLLFEIGDDINSVATALYDELMQDEEKFEEMAAQMLLDEMNADDDGVCQLSCRI